MLGYKKKHYNKESNPILSPVKTQSPTRSVTIQSPKDNETINEAISTETNHHSESSRHPLVPNNLLKNLLPLVTNHQILQTNE
jgi:hypothetical protein